MEHKMKMKGNTILITGGATGIAVGYETGEEHPVLTGRADGDHPHFLAKLSFQSVAGINSSLAPQRRRIPDLRCAVLHKEVDGLVRLAVNDDAIKAREFEKCAPASPEVGIAESFGVPGRGLAIDVPARAGGGDSRGWPGDEHEVVLWVKGRNIWPYLVPVNLRGDASAAQKPVSVVGRGHDGDVP